jgi:hypothetical protein
VVTAGGRDWLFLALDWRASDKGLAWAHGVLDAHRTLPCVLTTHDLAAADAKGVATLSAHGQRLWDRLIRRNDQIFLTLNGHYWPPGRTVLRNDAGHDVHVHIANYQDRYDGGAAMITVRRPEQHAEPRPAAETGRWIADDTGRDRGGGPAAGQVAGDDEQQRAAAGHHADGPVAGAGSAPEAIHPGGATGTEQVRHLVAGGRHDDERRQVRVPEGGGGDAGRDDRGLTGHERQQRVEAGHDEHDDQHPRAGGERGEGLHRSSLTAADHARRAAG